MIWAGHVACMGEKRNAYRVLEVGTPEGSRPLEKPKRVCEDNIKVDIRETGWVLGLDRSGLGYG